MDNTGVVEEALPRFLEGNNGKAILIVHGFRGYPGEFYELTEQLHSEGYTVSLPRLPGHGTNKKDFLSTGSSDWLNHVEEAYKELESKFETVYIVSLSMGGVLSLILASRFNPDKLIVMAPAMAVRSNMFYLTPILKFFIKEQPKEWHPEEGDSESRKILGLEYWSSEFPGQLAHMLKLINIAKRGLKKITCDTLIMLSEKDLTVPLKAGDIIKKGLTNCKYQEIILKNSPHVFVVGEEKDLVRDYIIDFLK